MTLKSMSYLLHFDVVITQNLFPSKCFGPESKQKGEKKSQLLLLPSSGHSPPLTLHPEESYCSRKTFCQFEGYTVYELVFLTTSQQLPESDIEIDLK